jgi:drug/metabolite transporter (DMT)-like permease/predicted Rossmann-fold nucleotide-binding protein
MMLAKMLLGLSVAACWGSADTLATFVTRRIGTASTTLIAQVAGLVLAAGVALALGLPPLSTRTLTLSVLVGVMLGAVAALAYLFLYSALERGPLAVASPVVSAQGGVTLALAVLILGEASGTWQMVFLTVTFVGVLLAAVNGREVQKLISRALLTPGVAFALVSMLCFGVLAFGLGWAARETNWLLCVVWMRMFSCLILAVFLRSPQATNAGRPGAWQGAWLAGAAVVGLLDVGGLLTLSLAAVAGPIGVIGMVASAYGVIPLAAGITLLKERPSPHQIGGVALLIAGLVGIAVPSSPVSLALLLLSGLGILLLILVPLARRWLRQRAERMAAQQRDTEPASVLRILRHAAAACDPRELLPLSVVMCGAMENKGLQADNLAAMETARLLAEAGLKVITDADAGVMDIDRWGTRDDGARTDLPVRAGQERETDALEVVTQASASMACRLLVAATVRAIVLFPGGIETLADLVEAACAMQAGELAPTPLLLYDSAYWWGLAPWLEARLAEAGLSALVHLCDAPREVAALVVATIPQTAPLASHQTGDGSAMDAARIV